MSTKHFGAETVEMEEPEGPLDSAVPEDSEAPEEAEDKGKEHSQSSTVAPEAVTEEEAVMEVTEEEAQGDAVASPMASSFR